MKNKFQVVYKNMLKGRRKLLVRSLILVLFLVGINIFAWFTFLSQASLSLTGNVASWDVEFNTDGEDVDIVDVEITDMKPGMTDYTKEVVIHNLGEVNAKISYSLSSLTILGKSIDVSDSDAVLTKLNTYYPFIFTFSSDKTSLDTEEYAVFKVNTVWSFSENIYYQMDELYDFDASVDYYRLSNNSYVVDDTITADNYLANRDSLYMFKDDADTYFGEQCGIYQNDTGKPCIEMEIKLVAQQKLNG